MGIFNAVITIDNGDGLFVCYNDQCDILTVCMKLEKSMTIITSCIKQYGLINPFYKMIHFDFSNLYLTKYNQICYIVRS